MEATEETAMETLEDGGGTVGGGSPSPVDGSWAWVVTVATFVVNGLLYGFAFITGMYFVVFLEVFQQSMATTAWIGSIYLGVLCVTGPAAAVLINRWSCRVTLFIGGLVSSSGQFASAYAGNIHTLFVTFGLITGFGHGLLLMAAVVAINRYFDRYRVLALGLSLLGTAFGTMVYPYVTRFLITTYGWRGALTLTAAINLHSCLAAMFVRPLPTSPKVSQTDGQNKDYKTKSLCETTKHLFVDIHFWLLCISNFVFVFGISVFITHIAAYVQWLGLPAGSADHLLSTLGISALFGRITTALIAQHPGVNVNLFLVICYVISGVAIISYGFWRGFVGLVVAVAIYGFFSATNGSVSAEFAAMVIGTESFATGYGYVLMWNGVGAVGGAPIAGALYDQTQDYPPSFFLAGSCMAVSGFLMAPTWWAHRHLAESNKTTQSTSINGGHDDNQPEMV